MQNTRRELLRGSAATLAGLSIAPALLACSGRRPSTATASVAPAAPGNEAEVDPYASLRGFCDGVPGVEADEYEDRTQRARAAMARHGLMALVVEAGRHYQFFTGTRWGQSERPMLYVLPRNGAPFWCSPAFEVPTLMGRVGDVEVVAWQENESPYATLRAGLEARGLVGPIGLDPDMRLFVASGITASIPGAAVAKPAFEDVRIVKTKLELERLRRANEATKAALQVAAGLLKAGITEPEFATIVREAQLAAGLEDIWVLALFGPNASYPHGSEVRRRACPSELVLVDTGGNLHGYQSDITRTWAFGDISTAERNAFDTVLAAQREAMDLIRPGARCGDVDAKARSVLAKAGYGPHYQRLTHRLGHGIGIQGHEAPYLVRDNPRVLQPGMTMSNEPGIYVRDAFGVRIEDIVAVTETGYEVFGPRVESFDKPFG